MQRADCKLLLDFFGLANLFLLGYFHMAFLAFEYGLCIRYGFVLFAYSLAHGKRYCLDKI